MLDSYNKLMTGKLTRKQVKALEQQIKHDDTQPAKPSEKPLKLHIGFVDAIKQLGRTKPKK